jgi:gamma-glutamyl:cysteine ligase YbdK (ATP-grasp superfamily)
VLGPEHEFSVVDDRLKPLPIVDKIIRDFCGRIVNSVQLPTFTFGKELQTHVLEVKPNEPFESPFQFEEIMQDAVSTLHEHLRKRWSANLLGSGMHPTLMLKDAGVWPHRHRQIYEVLGRIFNLRRHGWLNIQSYQLNLPYEDEESGVLLHNVLANLCAFLPAVAASSPVCEGKFGKDVDNRLKFYQENQKEVPSVAGDIVPEYVSSFVEYGEKIIGKYSSDLAAAGADKLLLNKEWINSRGVIFRFDRRALEIRVMDEQECIKSDVALSCYIRAAVRGLLRKAVLAPHETLVNNLRSIIADGLQARVMSDHGQTARQVCHYFLRVAKENANDEERGYLPLIEKRIEKGNLSEIIREKIRKKSQRTQFEEAIISVYLKLVESLIDNEPYF